MQFLLNLFKNSVKTSDHALVLAKDLIPRLSAEHLFELGRFLGDLVSMNPKLAAELHALQSTVTTIETIASEVETVASEIESTVQVAGVVTTDPQPEPVAQEVAAAAAMTIETPSEPAAAADSPKKAWKPKRAV